MKYLRVAPLALAGLAVSLALPAFAQTTAGDADAGAELFQHDCKACHSGAIAPVLRGVAGRAIASNPDFSGYSDALKAKKDQVWSDENLHAFLKSPNDFAPGTRMLKSTPDDQARADLIAYLKALPAPAK